MGIEFDLYLIFIEKTILWGVRERERERERRASSISHNSNPAAGLCVPLNDPVPHTSLSIHFFGVCVWVYYLLIGRISVDHFVRAEAALSPSLVPVVFLLFLFWVFFLLFIRFSTP